jgi:hypothetical protein
MPRTDRAAPSSAASDRPTSEFVGSIGEEVEVTAYVNFIGPVTNSYGDEERNVYLLRDANGNQLRTFGALRVFKGDRITLRGTVKKQDEWKGEKRTELAKVKVLTVDSK